MPVLQGLCIFVDAEGYWKTQKVPGSLEDNFNFPLIWIDIHQKYVFLILRRVAAYMGRISIYLHTHKKNLVFIPYYSIAGYYFRIIRANKKGWEAPKFFVPLLGCFL